jgi:hypothetical protein
MRCPIVVFRGEVLEVAYDAPFAIVDDRIDRGIPTNAVYHNQIARFQVGDYVRPTFFPPSAEQAALRLPSTEADASRQQLALAVFVVLSHEFSILLK